MSRAIDTIATAYGPRGSRVWTSEHQVATRNGLVIIRDLSATGLANIGVRELERVSDEMNRRVGDGRKVAMMLATAMVREAQGR